MKKVLVICALCALVLAGCASSKKSVELSTAKPEVKATAESKIVGAEGIKQPSWVTQLKDDKDFIYASGHAKFSNKINSEKAARMDANNNLGARCGEHIERVRNLYGNDAGDGNSSAVQQAFDEITRQTVDVLLYGVTQADEWVDPDGGVYILVAIPLENFRYSMNAAMDSVTEKKKAAATTDADRAAADKANEAMKAAMETYLNTLSASK
jgi:hypothetical protein